MQDLRTESSTGRRDKTYVKDMEKGALENRVHLRCWLQIRSEGGSLSKLFCVPVLVKDNYDTLDMSATAGTAGLLDNFPSQDAHQVC